MRIISEEETKSFQTLQIYHNVESSLMCKYFIVIFYCFIVLFYRFEIGTCCPEYGKQNMFISSSLYDISKFLFDIPKPDFDKCLNRES